VRIHFCLDKEAVELRLTGQPRAGRPPQASSLDRAHKFHAAYNTRVVNAKRQNGRTGKHPRHAIYATEASGLLLIAFLLLVLTLIRYWHAIHWSLR